MTSSSGLTWTFLSACQWSNPSNFCANFAMVNHRNEWMMIKGTINEYSIRFKTFWRNTSFTEQLVNAMLKYLITMRNYKRPVNVTCAVLAFLHGPDRWACRCRLCWAISKPKADYKFRLFHASSPNIYKLAYLFSAWSPICPGSLDVSIRGCR